MVFNGKSFLISPSCNSTMTLPNISTIADQILLILKDQKNHDISEVRDIMAKKLKLSKEELEKVSLAKKRPVFNMKIVYALHSLRKKGLLENEKLAVFKITNEGLNKIKQL